MAKFICPQCRGGFPAGPANDGCCPWCEQAIDGSYEPPTVHSISRVQEPNEKRKSLGEPLYKRLFGWLE